MCACVCVCILIFFLLSELSFPNHLAYPTCKATDHSTYSYGAVMTEFTLVREKYVHRSENIMWDS